MIRRLRTRPPVFAGHSPPILTQRICIKDFGTFLDGAHDVGGPFTIAEDPMPDFEIEEEPQPIAVNVMSSPMLHDHPLQTRTIEESSRLGSRAEHEFVDQGTEAVLQPLADRHRKAHLASSENR